MAKSLGPTATYLNLDGSARHVTFHGIRFTAHKPVDLIEELGEKRGAEALAKLDGNHFFEVEGSKQDHDEARENVRATRADADEDDGEERRAPRKADKHPGVKKGVAKRIAKEDAENEPEPVKTDDAPDAPEGELPDDVKTPDAPQLETAPRRPRLPRSRDA